MAETTRVQPAGDPAAGQSGAVPMRRRDDHLCHPRLVVDLTLDYVYSKDLTGRIVDVNASYLGALGRSREEVIGRREVDLFPAAVAAESTARDQIVLLTGRTLEVEASVVMQGRPRWLLVRSFPWRDARDAVRGVITVATDISDQKGAELERRDLLQDLRDANARMQLLLAEQTRVGRWASALLSIARQLSGQLDVVAIRQRALDGVESQLDGTLAALAELDGDTLRFTAFGTRGVRWRQVATRFAVTDTSFGDDVLQGRSVGASVQTESVFDRGARAVGIEHLVAVPIATEGTVVGLLLVGWTEREARFTESVWFLENIGVHIGLASHSAHLYTELAASLASLRSAQDNLVRTERLRALGEMASGVAHDFNNSLTTVLGLSDWLLHTLPAEAEGRADLKKIRTAAMDAAAFVRRLQQAGRLTRTAEERESVDVVEVAREVPELCRPRWAALACRPGVDFQVRVDTQPVPPVRAVAAEIRELLTNLVFNAIDAMPDGGQLTVRTRTVGGQAQVSVEDEGCGVPEEVRARIFEPFFTTKGKAGTGLGLSMCWTIAQRHGGTLGVQSEVGIGTTFTLTLPAEDDVDTSGVAVPTREARVPAQRILLVDDQTDVRESLTDLLESLGHDVMTAADGADAVRLIDQPC